MSPIKRAFPILETIRNYSTSKFKVDLPAGIMVAILLVPQAIAYAYLAGMPPQYGLYTALIPCLVYAIMGTSPHLAIGPVAVSALLVFAGVSQIAEPFSDQYVSLVILAGFFIGILQLLLGLIRAGTIINLLSYPVITGFTSAASIIVIVNQLKDIFGIAIPSKLSLIGKVQHLFSNINDTHAATLVIGIVTGLIIFTLKKISKRIPYGLVVVVLGIALSYLFRFSDEGIAVIGHVPQGLPSLSLPNFNVADTMALIPTILMVTIIGMIECIGIAKAIEGKHDYYNVQTNQELVAIGIAKIAGAFGSAIPSSGSFSRSALLHESGGKTTLASIFSTIMVVGALLFLTPLLFHLPKVILAVIIVFAVKNLFEWKLAQHYYKEHTRDLIVMITTFFLAIAVSIDIGIGLGFLMSFLMIGLQSKKPLKALGAVLSFKPQNSIEIIETDEHALVKVHEQLNFGNADYFKTRMDSIMASKCCPKEIVLDVNDMDHIDSCGCTALRQIATQAKEKKTDLIVEGCTSKTKKRIDSTLQDLPCQYRD